MTISLFQATIPTFLQQLRAQDAILAKTEAFCASNGISEADLLQRKLTDDMLPLWAQLKLVRHHSLGAVDGVRSGTMGPDMSVPPATLAAHRANLAEAVAGLESVDPAEFDGYAARDVRFVAPAHNIHRTFAAPDFLFSFSQPNFFFHLTTAYGLLRAAGVDIGKRDYLGAMRTKEPA